MDCPLFPIFQSFFAFYFSPYYISVQLPYCSSLISCYTSTLLLLLQLSCGLAIRTSHSSVTSQMQKGGGAFPNRYNFKKNLINEYQQPFYVASFYIKFSFSEKAFIEITANIYTQGMFLSFTA